MSNLTDPEAAHETLRLIDQRQEQILEDLDRLNERIETIIELHTANRESLDTTSNSAAENDLPTAVPRDEAA